MTDKIKEKAEVLIRAIETGSFRVGKLVEINGISIREVKNVVRQFKDELINCNELRDLKAALRTPREESEPIKPEYIFHSTNYLSEEAYTRLKQQIDKTSLKGKVIIVEGLDVIKFEELRKND